MHSPADCHDVPSRLKYARMQAGLDPTALRTALEKHGITLSKGGLHRLENTEPTNPNLKMIEAIAAITNVSPAWLLFGKGPVVAGDEAGNAINHRVIDTIELMSGALEMTARQRSTFDNWLKSVRGGKGGSRRKG